MAAGLGERAFGSGQSVVLTPVMLGIIGRYREFAARPDAPVQGYIQFRDVQGNNGNNPAAVVLVPIGPPSRRAGTDPRESTAGGGALLYLRRPLLNRFFLLVVVQRCRVSF